GFYFLNPLLSRLFQFEPAFRGYFVLNVIDVLDGKAVADVNHPPYLDTLKKMADLNWPSARKEYIRMLAMGTAHIAQNPNEIKRLAELGWEEAYESYLYGIANGSYGFVQDLETVKNLAHRGCPIAQQQIIRSIDRFNTSAHERQLIKQYADMGLNAALDKYIEGIAWGRYGFTQNPSELRRLAEVRRMADLEDPQEELSKRNYRNAYHMYLEGLTTGQYGIAQDPAELKCLAFEGCPYAQDLYTEALAYGKYGITKDMEELKALAHNFWQAELKQLIEAGYVDGVQKIHDLGAFTNSSFFRTIPWESAHILYIASLPPEEMIRLRFSDWRALRFVVDGFAEGRFGFAPNIEGLKELAEHGSAKAKRLYAWHLVKTNHIDELIELAENGCIVSQRIYVSVLSNGTDQTKPDHHALKRCAQKGWLAAQEEYFRLLLEEDRYAEAIEFLNDVVRQKHISAGSVVNIH
ncbi:MAG: hypothetical protein Q8K36_00520, partial [Alphaproteobacteria bacterium]|nr:hypothetical protein [Alphaproteobacteria bacterium]